MILELISINCGVSIDTHGGWYTGRRKKHVTGRARNNKRDRWAHKTKSRWQKSLSERQYCIETERKQCRADNTQIESEDGRGDGSGLTLGLYSVYNPASSESASYCTHASSSRLIPKYLSVYLCALWRWCSAEPDKERSGQSCTIAATTPLLVWWPNTTKRNQSDNRIGTLCHSRSSLYSIHTPIGNQRRYWKATFYCIKHFRRRRSKCN